MMMKSVAVLLSGSGHLDGSEIQESVCTLLALSKYDVDYECFSVDMDQYDVVDHLNKEPADEKRNVLKESARIARGDVKDITKLDPNDFEALIIPGGFGVAKNLFTYAYEGVGGKVSEQVRDTILSFYKMSKYIGAICISPVLVVMALQKEAKGLKVTPGFAKPAAEDIEKMGCVPVMLPSNEICVDEINKVITAPAYMNPEASLVEVYTGIEKLIKNIAERI
ncbi:MAG: isoprenoid biosynthesis glyoxalase ElbB [Candidatus Delongbacteria bacterium]